MGALDQILQLRGQGRSEAEIINYLKNQGVPPRDIQDALNQAEIKNAVSGGADEGMQHSIMDQQVPSPDQYYQPNYEQYQQAPQQPQAMSYAEPPPTADSMSPYSYAPQNYPPQENYPQEAYQQPGYPQENYLPEEMQQENYPEEYAQQEEYPQEEGYGYSSADSGTLIEIAEQVYADKAKKVLDNLDELSEFKTLSESQIKSFEERLRKLESIIDQLQISILERIGSYGKNLDTIRKEMSMMQDSFGKAVNPLFDKKSRI
jgi:hypothetical protein